MSRQDHWLEYEVLHSLDGEAIKKIVTSIRNSSPKRFSVKYDFLDIDRSRMFLSESEVDGKYLRDSYFITADWKVDKFVVELDISIVKMDQNSFVVFFCVCGVYDCGGDSDGLDAFEKDCSWYIKNSLEVLKSFKIASLYSFFEYEAVNLDSWGIQAQVEDLLWDLDPESKSEYEIKDIKRKLENVNRFVENGEKFGCKFKPYSLDVEAQKQPCLTLVGMFLGKDIFFELDERRLKIYLFWGAEHPKDVRPYLELFMAMCEGMQILEVRADSLALEYLRKEVGI